MPEPMFASVRLFLRRDPASRPAIIAVLVALAVSALPVAPAAAGHAARTVDFEGATVSFAEDAGVATLALVRGGDTSGTAVARVWSTGGTATAGTDYEGPVDVQVTFAKKQVRALVPIPLVADGRHERDETVTFALSSATKNTSTGPQDRSTLTISNDDAQPELSVSVREAAVEGGDAIATVSLLGATDLPASVSYATSDGSALAWQDYIPASGTLTFPPGTVERSVRVATIDDDVHEPSEGLLLTLSAPVDATVATATASAPINDNDLTHLLAVGDAASSEGGAVRFSVTMSRPSSERVYVDYATEDGTALAGQDYTATAGTLTIDPGQTTGTISVPSTADGKPEPDEMFTVRLWNPRGAAVGNGTAVGTIIDASPLPVLSIEHAVTVVEGGMASFRVTLSEPSTTTVSVRVTPQSSTASVGPTGSGADVVAPSQPATATFAPNAVTAIVTFATHSDQLREDAEHFRAVLSHAANADIGTGTATGIVRDDDQCEPLTGTERRGVLDRWINRLNPDADDDGDGFTNGQEVGVLAFDPDADPTRFNPLVADTPTVAVETIGDLSVALYDKLTEGTEVGRVKIRESELIDVDRQEDVHATTETHEVGASVSGEAGTEQGKKKAVVSAGIDYRYSRSTTHQQTSEVTRGARELRSEEVSRIVSTGREIEGGSIAVTVRITNTGHVAFRIESAPLILRYRDDAGTLLAFGTMQPNFAFGQGPTLSPGQAKDVLYEIGGVGATDTLALLEDASSLELGLSDDLELSEIGVGSIHVGAGNFAQYQNTIGQNTASLDIDDGRGSTDRYLVSTTSFRDAHGRPLGLAMCDAVQALLQRQLVVARNLEEGYEVTIPGDPNPGSVSSVLLGVGSARGLASDLVSEDESVNARWITRAHDDSVGGASYFGPSDVLLRARQAAQLVYYRDQDEDLLELRDEVMFGTSDEDADSDDDGLNDREEATVAWRVIVKDRAGNTIADYPVRSSPSSADADGDTVADPVERARGTDPWLHNTDRDQFGDDVDGALGPNGLAGAYFTTGHTNAYVAPTVDWAAAPTLVRTDPNIDFSWGTDSLSSALPVDGFAVRWTGSLVVPETKSYALWGAADDGYRVRLNGELILDGWHPGSKPPLKVLELTAWQPVSITYEYWEGTGNAAAQLLHYDGNAWTPVPGSWLAPDPGVLDAPAQGLSAEHYFDVDRNQKFDDGQAFYKVHDPVGPNHNWGTGSPKAETVPYNHFMSRWTGFITLPPESPAGSYTFGGKHDDGMSVRIGDDEVYSGTAAQGSPTYGTPIALPRGQRTPITVEHWDTGGSSYVELWVTLPDATSRKVPASWLTPADAFSPFERAVPAMRHVEIKNNAAMNITVKLTWGGGEVGCNEELVGGESHSCQIPGSLFHGVLTVWEVGGGNDVIRELTYDLPPPDDECYQVKGDLVTGGWLEAC